MSVPLKCGKIEKLLDWNKNGCGSRYLPHEYDSGDKKTKIQKDKKTKKTKKHKKDNNKKYKDRVPKGPPRPPQELEQGGQQFPKF